MTRAVQGQSASRHQPRQVHGHWRPEPVRFLTGYCHCPNSLPASISQSTGKHLAGLISSTDLEKVKHFRYKIKTSNVFTVRD